MSIHLCVTIFFVPSCTIMSDRINGSANLWTLSTGQLPEKNFSNVFGTMLLQFLNALVTALFLKWKSVLFLVGL